MLSRGYGYVVLWQRETIDSLNKRCNIFSLPLSVLCKQETIHLPTPRCYLYTHTHIAYSQRRHTSAFFYNNEEQVHYFKIGITWRAATGEDMRRQVKAIWHYDTE